MNNFKLKLILTILSSIIFSFIFILLALALPATSEKTFTKKPTGLLEAVSQSIKE
ncbi:hypothetical protein [Candidatus Sulfurimonas baltica]|uniref:Uncharacterized protein n=1 Tax=Candidatus Sulfurimonas baltica TaxID=2740404 RepID=A0A7S7LWT9_9BACT|nr:hypothetical protein [Candidatus Sulfurimonas baltica]QOY52928.1 hypothetical protein HUE88_04370 [Candidatus Sulfurimonas baltica]